MKFLRELYCINWRFWRLRGNNSLQFERTNDSSLWRDFNFEIQTFYSSIKGRSLKTNTLFLTKEYTKGNERVIGDDGKFTHSLRCSNKLE